MENARQTPTHHHNDASQPTLRHRVRVAAAQMFAFGLDPKRSALARVLACITGLGEAARTDDASPANNHDVSVNARPEPQAVWSDVVPPGGEVCAVPMPAMPDGVCGMPVESEPRPEHARPELLVCQMHAAEAADFDMFADLPPWEELPDLITDGPACPNCGTEVTRWDAISPDYPGCWWTCRNGHRFLLDHDGRIWRES